MLQRCTNSGLWMSAKTAHGQREPSFCPAVLFRPGFKQRPESTTHDFWYRFVTICKVFSTIIITLFVHYIIIREKKLPQSETFSQRKFNQNALAARASPRPRWGTFQRSPSPLVGCAGFNLSPFQTPLNVFWLSILDASKRRPGMITHWCLSQGQH